MVFSLAVLSSDIDLTPSSFAQKMLKTFFLLHTFEIMGAKYSLSNFLSWCFFFCFSLSNAAQPKLSSDLLPFWTYRPSACLVTSSPVVRLIEIQFKNRFSPKRFWVQRWQCTFFDQCVNRFEMKISEDGAHGLRSRLLWALWGCKCLLFVPFL